MTTTKEALEPQAAFTIRWCPVCGRDDRINSFKAAHYSRGELCRGVPVTIEYSRVSAPIAPVVDNLQRRLYEECVTANWDPERKNTFAEEIAHLHEELSEAFRAWRRYKDCEVREVNGKLEGVPIEFADTLIGMFYNAELYGFDLLAAVERKHQFNLNRNYVAEGRQLHAPAPASPAALRDETDRVSAFAGSEQLSAQEDKPVKNYGDFRAGMLRAAEMARNEFKRAPEAAKGHDCVYMGGYEDACDHLSVVIAQAAVIDSVRIAGPQPDWQYHISLLLPEGIEDQALLKIFQVVEYELRAATTPPSTLARKAAEEITNRLRQLDDGQWDVETVERIIVERCFSAESEK